MKHLTIALCALFLATNAYSETFSCVTDSGSEYEIVLSPRYDDAATIYQMYQVGEHGEDEERTRKLVYRRAEVDFVSFDYKITGSDNRVVDWDQEADCFKVVDPTLQFLIANNEGTLNIFPGILTQPNVFCKMPQLARPAPQSLDCELL